MTASITRVGVRLLTGLLLLVPVSRAQQRDRWHGLDPHEIPHCLPKGGKDSAPCRCLGGRAPRTDGLLTHFASPRGEKSGLGVCPTENLRYHI